MHPSYYHAAHACTLPLNPLPRSLSLFLSCALLPPFFPSHRPPALVGCLHWSETGAFRADGKGGGGQGGRCVCVKGEGWEEGREQGPDGRRGGEGEFAGQGWAMVVRNLTTCVQDVHTVG